MVFVLGVLTLLALIGLVMISRTHGESERLKIESVASSSRSVMNGTVRAIQERLRQDIWGPAPDPTYPVPLNNQNAGGFGEGNEPFDAPGDKDRWLSSTTPYMMLDTATGSPTYGQPAPQLTGNTATPTENGVLAWKHVSYLGVDVLQPSGTDGLQPFAWTANTRDTSPTPPPVFYDAIGLQDVKVLLTPPNGYTGNLIPGSTTNFTIAQARAQWDAELPTLAAMLAGQSPRFPYFDTNSDGMIDLYDADGDGVPDSPISFVLPAESSDPNTPKQLYAVIRIVDHAGMLNVNVASSALLPPPTGTGTQLMFDETLPGLQRRGRRMTELLLDDVVHPDDRFDQARGMVGYRSGEDPVAYDDNIVRRLLAGGAYAGPPNYSLYGLSDEASLRHRGMLAPYDRRLDAGALATDYRTIDRALRGTLTWSREVDAAGSYTGTTARWSRLNSNWVDANYEGSDAYPPVSPMSWRWMMREDETYAIRRPLLTTISQEVDVSPDITSGLTLTPAPGESRLDALLRQLWALGMDWPVLISATSPLASDAMRPSNAVTDNFIIPANKMPAEWARDQPIDLGMKSAGVASILAAKEALMRYLAAAIYLAMPKDNTGTAAKEGTYQGQLVDNDPATADDELLNREYFAWQFALNVADYRDSDNTPTMIEWPAASGHWLFGVEKQPFLTEAYACLTAGGPSPDSTPASSDQWFYAVELYVPPYWKIPTVDPSNPSQPVLYLHPTGLSPDTLYAINSFARIPGGQILNELDGGASGAYYVFCGDTTAAPLTIMGGPDVNGFYRNNAFKFKDDGAAGVEIVYSPTGNIADALTHAIDLISPAYSGEPLAGTTSSGSGSFAKNNSYDPGTQHEFTLLRSTQGPRFTVGWQVYAHKQTPDPIALPDTLRQSLGSANDTGDSLDEFVPPSVWPARVAMFGNNPPESFGPGQSFEAFDSPADINRMLLFGSVRRDLPTTPPYLYDRTHTRFGVGQLPVPILLAETAAMTELTDGSTRTDDLYPGRITAGHIDFVKAKFLGDIPWSTRLLSYLSTKSPLFDGIDNDGDGSIDLAADPTEAIDVLNRIAGRININTAPVSVLRAVPFMSLLPTSAEFIGGPPLPGHDYTADFAADPNLFYDLATAIVFARDGKNADGTFRNIPVRLPDNTGALRSVAATGLGIRPRFPPVPGIDGRFYAVADLDRMTHVNENMSGSDAIFRSDRYVEEVNPALGLYSHRFIGTDPDLGSSGNARDVFSPDFRYRRADSNNNGTWDGPAGGDDYVVDYAQTLPAGQVEYAGLRARDIFVNRWANMLTVRSDVFTAYIALLDDQGHYVQRCQVTLDRSECFRERPGLSARPGTVVLPRIVTRTDGSYEEEIR